MAPTPSGAVRDACTRRRPPQRAQAKTSSAKVRRSSPAQSSISKTDRGCVEGGGLVQRDRGGLLLSDRPPPPPAMRTTPKMTPKVIPKKELVVPKEVKPLEPPKEEPPPEPETPEPPP